MQAHLRSAVTARGVSPQQSFASSGSLPMLVRARTCGSTASVSGGNDVSCSAHSNAAPAASALSAPHRASRTPATTSSAAASSSTQLPWAPASPIRASCGALRKPSAVRQQRRVAAAAASAAAPADSPSSVPAQVSDESKAAGCLLGAMCGNVLGGPYEGSRHYQVVRARPNGVTDFWKYDIGRQALQYGQYTGDFANLVAVARALVEERGVTTEGVISSLLGSYDPDMRPYNLYDSTVMDALLAGTAPQQVPQLAERYLAEVTRRRASTSSDSLEREPFGPADYCAAARAAPIGFAYRSADGSELLSAVRRSLIFSHATPLGLDAAHVVAAAAAWCARQQPADTIVCRPEALLTHLINDVAVTADLVGKLRVLRDNLAQVGEVKDWRAFYLGPKWAVLTQLLTRMSFHGYATVGSEFTVVALLAFLTSWGRPEQAVIVAASLGGHAGATAQVVGALAGALHGRDWVPARWFDALENSAVGSGGRDEVVELASQLGGLQLKSGS